MAISQIPVKFIFHSYSDSSIFGRPGHGRSIPHQMAISQIPALTAHISWQLIFHSYSESSTFGRPGLGRSTSLINGNFTDSWSTFLSESSYLADQVLADLTPHINGNFTDSCSTLRDHIWQTKFGRSTPHIKWQFNRFLWNSYFIPTLTAQHLADQFLADVTPVKWQFHKFLLYSESSYLADYVLADQPPIIWEFHRLLLWQVIFHSYSESSTFGRQGLGRSTPLINDNFTDSWSTLKAHIWQTKCWQI